MAYLTFCGTHNSIENTPPSSFEGAKNKNINKTSQPQEKSLQSTQSTPETILTDPVFTNHTSLFTHSGFKTIALVLLGMVLTAVATYGIACALCTWAHWANGNALMGAIAIDGIVWGLIGIYKGTTITKTELPSSYPHNFITFSSRSSTESTFESMFQTLDAISENLNKEEALKKYDAIMDANDSENHNFYVALAQTSLISPSPTEKHLPSHSAPPASTSSPASFLYDIITQSNPTHPAFNLENSQDFVKRYLQLPCTADQALATVVQKRIALREFDAYKPVFSTLLSDLDTIIEKGENQQMNEEQIIESCRQSIFTSQKQSIKEAIEASSMHQKEAPRVLYRLSSRTNPKSRLYDRGQPQIYKNNWKQQTAADRALSAVLEERLHHEQLVEN